MKTEREIMDETLRFVRETFEFAGGPMPSQDGIEYAAKKIVTSLMATLAHADAAAKRADTA